MQDNADNANSEQAAAAAADKLDPVAVDEEDSNSADATNDVSVSQLSPTLSLSPFLSMLLWLKKRLKIMYIYI